VNETLQAGARILDDVEISIPARFKQIAALYPFRTALGGKWQPTYAELDAATNRLANVLISRGGKQWKRWKKQSLPSLTIAIRVGIISHASF